MPLGIYCTASCTIIVNVVCQTVLSSAFPDTFEFISCFDVLNHLFLDYCRAITEPSAQMKLTSL